MSKKLLHIVIQHQYIQVQKGHTIRDNCREDNGDLTCISCHQSALNLLPNKNIMLKIIQFKL